MTKSTETPKSDKPVSAQKLKAEKLAQALKNKASGTPEGVVFKSTVDDKFTQRGHRNGRR